MRNIPIAEKGFSNRLTCLSEKESEKYLKKYEKIIRKECERIGRISGYDIDDLCQECRIKLLSVFHLFDEQISSEKTWTITIIKRTLSTIRKQSVSLSRATHIPTPNGKFKPVFDISFDRGSGIDGDFSMEEAYDKRKYDSPSFSSDYYNPEELVDIKVVLDLLKEKLSPEIYEYLETKITSENPTESILKIQEKFNRELKAEGFRGIHKTKTFGIFRRAYNLTNIAEKESDLLSEIAKVMVGELDFIPSDILFRGKTLDLKYSALQI